MTIHISPKTEPVLPEIKYLFKILALNKKAYFDFVISDSTDAPRIGTDSNSTLLVSKFFANRELHRSRLNPQGLFTLENGAVDFISTAFFYLTCMQEHTDGNKDVLGRFSFSGSIQSKFNNVTANVVQVCFDEIASLLGIRDPQRKSTFFLSHDIDSVYGSIMEDGFNVLKKGRLDQFLNLLVHVAMSRPDWLNIDKIIKLESEYDCRSTFYWIVNKGKIDGIQQNADYDFKNSEIQKQFKLVEDSGFENGIHKSLGNESFESEIKKFGKVPTGNRYHYLKFNLPGGFEAIENAGLKLDASLGFSEQWGFRNNYGLPFCPYDFKSRKPFSFVEVPLHIMDRTFFNKRMPLADVEKAIFDFFESNKNNCVISVLWHNNFFTGYKYNGYLSLYKKILAYIKEGNFGTTTQQEMIQTYKISWP